MGKDTAQHKNKSRRWIAGGLCAVFAAVALTTAACGPTHQQQSAPAPQATTSAPAAQHVSAPSAEPGSITVFSNTATRAVEANDPYKTYWTTMLQDQSTWSKEQKYAPGYNSFLAQFNGFRGQTLGEMATNVNALVEREIKYNDTLYGKADMYWATPIETILNKAGDCKDQTALQYFILRHLGVPENRLFIADVNAEGSATAGPDHSILLLNVAAPGALPKFVVLNDAPPVLPADNAVIGKTWEVEPGNIKADFVFYGARNQTGFWQDKLTPLDYQQPQKQAQVFKSHPGSKSQVARVNPPAFRRFGRA